MTIFAIHSSWGRGGSTINLAFIVKTLVGKGHKVIVLNHLKDEGSDLLKKYGARTIHINFPLKMNTTAILENTDISLFMIIKQNLKDILRLIVGFVLTFYYLLKIKPDILFLTDVTFPQCAVVGFILGVPTVCNIQAEIIRGRWGIRRHFLIKVINKCNKIFGITSAHIKPLVEKSLDKKKFSVIHNTIQTTEQKPSRNDEWLTLNIPDDKKIVSYFGGASCIKGYKLLLDIIKEITAKRNDIIFIFAGAFHKNYSSNWAVGTDPGNLSLRDTMDFFELVDMYNISNHLRIIGERSDVITIMRKSNVVIVPNELPHFSRPIIEAFSEKTPVLATDDTFNREVIQDGINGLLASYGDVDDWVQKLERLLDDELLVKNISENGYVSYISNYEPSEVASKILNSFETINNRMYKND